MNELATMLHESVTRLFDDLADRETLEAAEEGAWPDALWKAIDEIAVTQALVPESAGGVGASWSDVEVVLRAAGRHTVPAPLVENLIALWLCAESGVSGPEGITTLAPTGELAIDAQGRASGLLERVPWGGRADAVVAEGVRAGEHQLVVLAPGAAEVVPGSNLAREPREGLRFDGAEVLGCAPVRETGAGTVRLFGALGRAAQMAGALDHLLEESVRFVNDRVQFGRPIAKFQAIQHQLAVLASEAAAAGASVSTACRAAESADPRFEIAVAKARTGEAAGIAARIAHAVHGAIGFTYEHALHFATRRLWSWRTECGAEAEWTEWLGREALGRGPDRLWSDLTAR